HQPLHEPAGPRQRTVERAHALRPMAVPSPSSHDAGFRAQAAVVVGSSPSLPASAAGGGRESTKLPPLTPLLVVFVAPDTTWTRRGVSPRLNPRLLHRFSSVSGAISRHRDQSIN